MAENNLRVNIKPLLIPLFVSNAFSICLLIARLLISKKITYLFLSWNLALATIPFLVACFLYHNKQVHSRYFFLLIFPLWLFFYPNAPYIITDLLHLKAKAPLPLWYDVALLSSFAWNGLFLGLLSLYYMEKSVLFYFNKTIANLTIVISIILSGYGIYIGRFMRWNSWDMLNNPVKLWDDVSEPLFNPHENLKVYAFTIIFAALTALIFYLLKAFVKAELNAVNPSR